VQASLHFGVVKKFSGLLIVLLSIAAVLFETEAATAQASMAESTRKVINRVVPVYPAMARGMNLTGTVNLQVLVLANGTVKSVQVKGGHPLLVLAAQDAVHSWKWEKADHDSIELVEFRFSP